MLTSIIAFTVGYLFCIGVMVWVAYRFVRIIGKDFDLW